MKSVSIEGMSCNHCVMAVTKALSGLAGVTDVKVDLLGKKATFEPGPSTSDAEVVAAIKKAGFIPGEVK